MSQVAAPQMPTPPNQMKKKVISIVAAVLVGHVGVLYAISQMKAPELTPIDKQPLKVRFVKLQEAPKPLPPKPKAEPQKEPPKPKEVKIVDKPLPPPPKKVEKIEQVKKAEAPKVVKAPPVEAKPTPSPVVPTVVTETKVKPHLLRSRHLRLWHRQHLLRRHHRKVYRLVGACPGSVHQKSHSLQVN